MYENSNGGEDTNKIYEKLGLLQELGAPPQDLMKKVSDKQFGSGSSNPFKGLWNGLKDQSIG